MATTTDLLVGAAEDLHDRDIGVWNPLGEVPGGQTAITAKLMPAAPDQVICLTLYTVSTAITGDAVQGMQVRTRMPGHPSNVDDLDDLIYQAWHGLGPVLFGGVKVKRMWRQSHASLGRDTNGRWLSTANFYAAIDRPTPHTR